MFETIEAARSAINKLTDKQLVELTQMLVVEWALGTVTDQQAEFVAALVADTIMDRMVARMELDAGATVN